MRFSAGPPGSPATPTPETSPFTSAANTATPAADSCSAIVCSVTVLPVPVAPATRPWRFIIRSGIWTTAAGSSSPSSHAASELDRRTVGGVRRRDRLAEVGAHRGWEVLAASMNVSSSRRMSGPAGW